MMRRSLLVLPLFAIACGSSDDEGGTPPRSVPLTTDVTWMPELAPNSPADSRSPSDPDLRKEMLAEGYGRRVQGPGETHSTRMPPGKTAPAPGANAARVARFLHLPDIQLADDESPTRLAAFDSPGATAGAYRPQDSHMCHVLNAAVRSANFLHEKDPIDFVLLGGDNADSAQQNEIDWLLALLSGATTVECDSGDNDDPVKGGGNDGKDALKAEGLSMPWYWVTGNHDILVQGNLPITPDKVAESIGENAVGGTRDWSQPGGPIFKGPVIADPARTHLTRTEIMSRVAGHGDGHGLSSTEAQSGKAIYTFDVPGSELRFLVLDTAAETGGSEGLIRQGDMDGPIKSALDQAQADGKWVALSSHHATTSLGDGSGLGGAVQPDAVTEAAWLAFVGQYPNVVLSFVGHSHENRVKLIGPSGGHAWWEIMTSALADYPHQMRIVEIFDQDNGWIMVRTTNVDWSDFGDRVAREGRTLGILDYVAGWVPKDAPGTTDDRNVELWIEKP